MSNNLPESEPKIELEPEAEIPEVSTEQAIGSIAAGEAVVAPAKKPDFTNVTFEQFLHPIGW